MQRIFLIGPPGAGKTAVGQTLAEILDCDFFDTDKLIEASEQRSVSTIFAESGESYFRKLEAELLERIDQIRSKPASAVVFATGGGLPVFNDNIKRLLVLGKVVTLNADISTLVSRLRSDTKRPLLAGAQELEADDKLQIQLTELLRIRWPVYAQAGYKIDTSGLSPAEVAKEIIKLLD